MKGILILFLIFITQSLKYFNNNTKKTSFYQISKGLDAIQKYMNHTNIDEQEFIRMIDKLQKIYKTMRSHK